MLSNTLARHCWQRWLGRSSRPDGFVSIALILHAVVQVFLFSVRSVDSDHVADENSLANLLAHAN
jgi:hypothetical protein